MKEELRAEIDRKKEVVARWVERGSGRARKYNPIKGGAYIPLPPKLQGKQAIINIKSKDDKCLRWALKAWRFPAKNHCDRPSQYPTEDSLDFTGISFPTPICEIPKVEKLNNVAINVLGWDEGKVIILHASKIGAPDIPSVNMMYITKGQRSHYCYIKSLSRLLYSQQCRVGKHLHFCERCLQGFKTEGVLAKYRPLRRGASNRPTRVEMPEKEKSTLEFQNY